MDNMDPRISNLPRAYRGFSPDAFKEFQQAVTRGTYDLLLFFLDTKSGALVPYTHSAETEEELVALQTEVTDMAPVGYGPHVACCSGGQLMSHTNIFGLDIASPLIKMSPLERITAAINRPDRKRSILSNVLSESARGASSRPVWRPS